MREVNSLLHCYHSGHAQFNSLPFTRARAHALLLLQQPAIYLDDDVSNTLLPPHHTRQSHNMSELKSDKSSPDRRLISYLLQQGVKLQDHTPRLLSISQHARIVDYTL